MFYLPYTIAQQFSLQVFCAKTRSRKGGIPRVPEGPSIRPSERRSISAKDAASLFKYLKALIYGKEIFGSRLRRRHAKRHLRNQLPICGNAKIFRHLRVNKRAVML